MEQNNKLDQNVKVSKFNLIFRTTYFSKSNKIRKLYSIFLFTTVILLFVFLILSLIMTFSFGLNLNYYIKDSGTDTLTTLFGSLDNYNNWAKSTVISGAFGTTYSAVSGGAVTLGDVLNISSMVTATSALSFISVVLIIITICFKKQSLASYISFGLSFMFLIILIALFAILLSKGAENNVIMNFSKLGSDLKASVGESNGFKTSLEAISKFLQGLKA